MKDTIQEGDIVRVDFSNGNFTLIRDAKVIRKPIATGDGWVFEVPGFTYHVTEGCTITRRNKE